MLATITLAADMHLGLDAMAQRGLEANMILGFSVGFHQSLQADRIVP
jgi:hypothetical protein